MTAFKNV